MLSDEVYIGALDQGTTSTRFMIFTAVTGQLITYHQEELKLIHTEQGWAEIDANLLFSSSIICIDQAVNNFQLLGFDKHKIVSIGITNQRETTVVWDAKTGLPLYNSIIWLDTRTKSTVDSLINKCPNKDPNYLKDKCGLPISTYFSALKLRWMLNNVEAVDEAYRNRRLMCGTVDTWLVWNLTGGVNGGIYVTDVTNASRTLLMNLYTLEWDASLCQFFDIDMAILPEIRSSSEIYGRIEVDLSLKNVYISAILGDQQAALIGHSCFTSGQIKATYGTGAFILCHTGSHIVNSKHGLLTTVAYQLGPHRQACYALEGSIAIAGAAVQWLRDNMCMIENYKQVEQFANQVNTTGNVYFVPAFSGLFSPYWDPTARGILCGISQFTNRMHVCRAVLESLCFQTRDVIEAIWKETKSADLSHSIGSDVYSMDTDCMNLLTSHSFKSLQVDGAACGNSTLMQILANILGVHVNRPCMPEVTALGAAMAAGQASGIDVWPCDDSCQDELKMALDNFIPEISNDERCLKYQRWHLAVEKSRGWNIPQTLLCARQHSNSLSIETPERRQFSVRLLTKAFFCISTLLILKLSSILSR